MSKSLEARLFDYGLDAAQEERAGRLHKESIIIDMLYQGPVGSAGYTEDMVKQIIKDYEKDHDAWRNLFMARALPVRMAVWKENYEYPYPLHTKLIKRIYDEVGAERLLWGSDMPNTYRTCTYRQCLDLVRLHFDFMSEEEKGLVLGGNAAKLFRV